MADGQATKIIVPSEIANLTGTLSALSEAVRTPGPAPHAPAKGAPVPGVRREAPARPQPQKTGIIDHMMSED